MAAASGLSLALVLSSLGSRCSRLQQIRRIRVQLADAVREQNFESASRLKEEARSVRAGDPVLRLDDELLAAVSREDFVRATGLRDEQRELARSSGLPPSRLVGVDVDGANMWVRDDPAIGDRVINLRPEGLAPGTFRVQQPTWCTRGEHIAVTLITAAGWAGLVVFDAESGREASRVQLPIIPFYYKWSADANVLTCLGAEGGSLVLLRVDPFAGAIKPLARGAPIYYSLGPGAGPAILAHNGAASAIQYLPDGAAMGGATWRTVLAGATTVQAPWWCRWPGGEAFVYVHGDSIVASGRGAQARGRVIADSPGPFIVDREGRRIAIANECVVELVEVAHGRRPTGALLDPAGRTALSLGTVDLKVAMSAPSSGTIAAMWFSPGGRWLIALTQLVPEDKGSWTWAVVDCDARRLLGWTPPFHLSPVLASLYLPFFTQYAQSASPFSPDGGAFCYATEEGSFVATLLPGTGVRVEALAEPRPAGVVWWSTPAAPRADVPALSVDAW